MSLPLVVFGIPWDSMGFRGLALQNWKKAGNCRRTATGYHGQKHTEPWSVVPGNPVEYTFEDCFGEFFGHLTLILGQQAIVECQ